MTDEGPNRVTETNRSADTPSTPESDDDYLAPGDVARLLRVSPRTVSRWADQGRIPHVVTMGGHRRFRRSDIAPLTHP